LHIGTSGLGTPVVPNGVSLYSPIPLFSCSLVPLFPCSLVPLGPLHKGAPLSSTLHLTPTTRQLMSLRDVGGRTRALALQAFLLGLIGHLYMYVCMCISVCMCMYVY
jgi:hypothetical protein